MNRRQKWAIFVLAIFGVFGLLFVVAPNLLFAAPVQTFMYWLTVVSSLLVIVLLFAAVILESMGVKVFTREDEVPEWKPWKP
jgi:uncharacterized membrane protein